VKKHSQDWIDISIPIHEKMVDWPEDPPFRINRILDIEKGDSCNLSRITMGVHSGTHIDSPFHFSNNGKSIDEIPADTIIGRTRVLDLTNLDNIDVKDLDRLKIKSGERLLFKTRNSENALKSSHFVEDYIYVTREAAKLLAKQKINMVGIDYLSIGSFHDKGDETHRILLNAGIWILENINLSSVTGGEYDLICLPLKIVKGDGAPARAFLRKITVV
jgi:arylformamidase